MDSMGTFLSQEKKSTTSYATQSFHITLTREFTKIKLTIQKFWPIWIKMIPQQRIITLSPLTTVDAANGSPSWEIFVLHLVEFMCIGVWWEEPVVIIVLFETVESPDVQSKQTQADHHNHYLQSKYLHCRQAKACNDVFTWQLTKTKPHSDMLCYLK